MNRTLFLLNALALVALVGLTLQPQSAKLPTQDQALPGMNAQLTVFDSAVRSTPVATQSPRFVPAPAQGRLTF